MEVIISVSGSAHGGARRNGIIDNRRNSFKEMSDPNGSWLDVEPESD
jgi:hypothetical protein